MPISVGRVTRVVLVALALFAQACGSNDASPVHVTIRKGSNFREAADSLAAHQLVSTPRLFGFTRRAPVVIGRFATGRT